MSSHPRRGALPEAEQGEQSKEAAENDEPGADEEGAARIVDVVDPVHRVPPSRRNDRLYTAPSGGGDTDNEGQRSQDRAEAPALVRLILRIAQPPFP
jgi:hypothetical protein